MVPTRAITALLLLQQGSRVLSIAAEGGSWFETCSLQSKCIKLEVTRVDSNMCSDSSCEYKACLELAFGGDCRMSVEESIRGSCVKKDDECNVDTENFKDAKCVIGRNGKEDPASAKYLAHGGRQCQTGPAGSTVHFLLWQGPHGCNRYQDLMPGEKKHAIGDWKNYSFGQHAVKCAPRPANIKRCDGPELSYDGMECAWKVELPSNCGGCEDFDASKCGYQAPVGSGRQISDEMSECNNLITPWNYKRPVVLFLSKPQVDDALKTIKALYVKFLKKHAHPFFLYSEQKEALDELKSKIIRSDWLDKKWTCMFFYYTVQIPSQPRCDDSDAAHDKEVAFWFKYLPLQRTILKKIAYMRITPGVEVTKEVADDPFEDFDTQGYKYGYPNEQSKSCPRDAKDAKEMTKCLQRRGGSFEDIDASDIPCKAYSTDYELVSVRMVRKPSVLGFTEDMYRSHGLFAWGYDCIRSLMAYLYLTNKDTKEFHCSGGDGCLMKLCPVFGNCPR